MENSKREKYEVKKGMVASDLEDEDEQNIFREKFLSLAFIARLNEENRS